MAPPDVLFLEELRSRISTAMADDGVLEGVKRLKIGPSEEALGGDDSAMPFINIDLVSGSMNPESPNNLRTETLNVLVTLACSKLASESNKLYKVADSTGALYLFAALRNVIEKSTAGAIDNGFDNTVQNFAVVDYRIAQNQFCVECQLNISVKTHTFIAGGR